MLRLLPFLLLASIAHADEGYWLFTDPPKQTIADKYHVTLDADWLQHLRNSVVKIGGGTGCFVSPDGLVITNHHVGEGQLHTLSTRQHNYEEDGFSASSPHDEIPCQGFELLVLQQTENVTDRVTAAVKKVATPEEAEAAQKAVEAAIEKESFNRTGLTSEVITLFGGARYDLYRYKKYPDVRLVFAPERQIAFFGGDPDNFEFPRYDLDISFFRVYDHGKPLRTPDYLKWNKTGPAKDELVFVAGHPGFSQRLVTMDEIDYLRDFRLPHAVAELDHLEHQLNDFCATSSEHRREAAAALASIANGRKATHGFLSGLRQTEILDVKSREETGFRAQLAQHPEQKSALDAYTQIRHAVESERANYNAYQGYERFANRSDLFNMARTIVRAAGERAKPNGERLPAYRDSALPSLEFRLFSGRPYYPDLETFFLTEGFNDLFARFGADDPLVKKNLAGKSPQDRAKELVHGSKLEEIAYRKKIYAGGAFAPARSGDPLLELAALIDPAARTARKLDDQNEETRHRAYATIYQARVDLHCAPAYPDATGTLRLAYGTVTGFESDGHWVEPLTTFAGLYTHSDEHHGRAPFDIPAAWSQETAKLNPETPFNFVTTADILGGNSGSPVVNQAGEFVGIIFDGNRASLAGRYVYDHKQNRSVAVDSAAILEALQKIYHAGTLVKEINR